MIAIRPFIHDLFEDKRHCIDPLLFYAHCVALESCPKLTQRQWNMLLGTLQTSSSFNSWVDYGIATAFIDDHDLSPEDPDFVRILQLTNAERLSVLFFAIYFWDQHGVVPSIQVQLAEFSGRPVEEVFA